MTRGFTNERSAREKRRDRDTSALVSLWRVILMVSLCFRRLKNWKKTRLKREETTLALLLVFLGITKLKYEYPC
jgi:hypothetical protein